MSKIQEIKYDGQKMCEKIKSYQEVMKKQEKQLEAVDKQLKEVSPVSNNNRKEVLRRFSIPVDGLFNLET